MNRAATNMNMELIVDFPQDKNAIKPRVTFTDRIEMKSVENITLKYKADLFFSAREVQMFKLRNVYQLNRLRESGPEAYFDPELDTADIMGLEKCLTEETYQACLRRREAYSKAVISEQERQISLGIYDAHALALISEQASETSRTRAHIIGLLHAENKFKCIA